MKILYVTTISLTMNSFFKPHIDMLIREGHSVDLACNYKDLALDGLYSELGCNFYQIDFSRSPLSPDNIRAYSQLKEVMEKGNYDIVHCHTPNASVITRLLCRKLRKKNGLKVFYTAHGFHFYKGAPKLNWLVFYPIEKFCSRYTDKLITINKEDYALAKNKFKAKEVHYVPGVGIDLTKIDNVQTDRTAKRKELGIPDDAFLTVSVGELSRRKNHELVIEAMSEMKDTNIHYIIVGNGPLEMYLKGCADKLGLTDRVHFMGYRSDVSELYKASDLCCFPSVHEGLPVAIMEAMACGLPVICSRIRGNTDLIDENGGILFDCFSKEECLNAIETIKTRNMRQIGDYNRELAKQYSVENITSIIKNIYES